jgi:two-component system nitrate/nitrite response regulator NarL
MREALVSLMEGHSYQVICSVGSAADIERSVFKEEPGLVILGALPTDRVADATSSIRKNWPGAKIIMLFEHASSMDSETLLASDFDACIPLCASLRALIDTLRLIACESLRILLVSGSTIPRAIVDEAMQERQALVESLPPSLQVPSAAAMPCTRGLLAKDADATGDGTYGLSEREEQILKALVRGYSNKMIARMCSVTEATVKAHMKSILRKVRVANRTQAAIWALRNTYPFPQQAPEGHSGSANVSRPRLLGEAARHVSQWPPQRPVRLV